MDQSKKKLKPRSASSCSSDDDEADKDQLNRQNLNKLCDQVLLILKTTPLSSSSESDEEEQSLSLTAANTGKSRAQKSKSPQAKSKTKTKTIKTNNANSLTNKSSKNAVNKSTSKKQRALTGTTKNSNSKINKNRKNAKTGGKNTIKKKIDTKTGNGKSVSKCKKDIESSSDNGLDDNSDDSSSEEENKESNENNKKELKNNEECSSANSEVNDAKPDNSGKNDQSEALVKRANPKKCIKIKCMHKHRLNQTACYKCRLKAERKMNKKKHPEPKKRSSKPLVTSSTKKASKTSKCLATSASSGQKSGQKANSIKSPNINRGRTTPTSVNKKSSPLKCSNKTNKNGNKAVKLRNNKNVNAKSVKLGGASKKSANRSRYVLFV